MGNKHLPFKVKFAKFLSYITFNQFKPALLYKYKCILSYIIKDQMDVIQKWNINYTVPEEALIPKIIWVMWWTGDYHDNPIVSVCIERIKCFAENYGYDFRFICENNIGGYIDITKIEELYRCKKICIQSLADSIRLKLLRKYGGFWMDATLFLTKEAYSFLNLVQNNQQFFSIKLKNYPKWKNVSGGAVASYFWATFRDNPYFCFLDEFYNGFLLKHSFSIDYFMLDYSIRVAYDKIEFARKLIDNLAPSNPDIYFFNRHLFDQYNESVFNSILKSTCIFKMNWRKKISPKDLSGTYWNIVIKE